MTEQINDAHVRFWRAALGTEYGAYNDLQRRYEIEGGEAPPTPPSSYYVESYYVEDYYVG